MQESVEPPVKIAAPVSKIEVRKREYKCFTLIAGFEDPGVQIALK